jgi:hypothetical protein
MIFGKGMNGTYYFPVGGEIPDENITFSEVDYRDIIEIGYLQLLLSGGIIHVVLLLMVLLPAAILGISRSLNLFSKACGLIILLWLVDMLIYGLPILSLHYIFVWICVGICYSPGIRNMSEDAMRSQFFEGEIL